VLVDSHCHIDFDCFDSDRAKILSRCREFGISHLIVPSVGRSHWDKTIRICSQYRQLLPALGMHPYNIEQHQLSDIDVLNEAVRKHSPIAIGEIGLDFYLASLDKDKQQQIFLAQLEIAQKHQLPVIIHARKAHQQIIECLRRIKTVGGIIHAFNGSLEQAREYIKLNFKLGFGGAFTNPKANKLRKLAVELPLTSIVLETDAPDMLPHFVSASPNSPEYLPQIFEGLVELRNEDKERLEMQIFSNCADLFPDIKQ